MQRGIGPHIMPAMNEIEIKLAVTLGESLVKALDDAIATRIEARCGTSVASWLIHRS